MAKTVGTRQLRGWFLYPKSDKITQEWLDAQYNNSISIRLLIARYVEAFGYTDVTGLCKAPSEGGEEHG